MMMAEITTWPDAAISIAGFLAIAFVAWAFTR